MVVAVSAFASVRALIPWPVVWQAVLRRFAAVELGIKNLCLNELGQ